MGIFTLTRNITYMKNTLDMLGVDTSKIQETISEFASGIVDAIKESGGVGSVISDVKDTYTEHYENGNNEVQAVWNTITDTSSELVDMAKSNADGVVNDTEIQTASTNYASEVQQADGVDATVTTGKDRSKSVDSDLGDTVGNIPQVQDEGYGL